MKITIYAANGGIVREMSGEDLDVIYFSEGRVGFQKNKVPGSAIQTTMTFVAEDVISFSELSDNNGKTGSLRLFSSDGDVIRKWEGVSRFSSEWHIITFKCKGVWFNVSGDILYEPDEK